MKRAQAPAHVLFVLACASAPACGLNQSGVDPPDTTIAYPASAVMDKNGDWLFVTNSNADLRFNDGSLMAFSLKRAEDDRKPGAHPDVCPAVNYDNPIGNPIDLCCRDPLDPNLTNCDERQYVGDDNDAPYSTGEGNGDGNVRIGSFAAGMVRQQPACPTLGPYGAECDVCAGYTTVDDRLLIGVRGDTSLTFIDVESRGPKLTPLMKCVGPVTAPEAKTDFTTCDDAHRVITAMSGLATPSEDPDPPPIPLPDEPYALALDGHDGLLFIGHLSGNTARPFTGGFSLFDISPGGTAGQMEPVVSPGQPSGHLGAPRFIAPFPSPFSPNSVGSLGVTALNETDGTVYASSRYSPQVSGLGTTATCASVGSPVREIAAFPNGSFYSSPVAGTETRGIQFADGKAFVLQRSPPALIAFLPSNSPLFPGTPTDVLETCSSPTFLDKYDSGVGDRLFVTCFADGEIYVYDPTIPRLVKTLAVGRGPSGLVFDNTNGRNVAYVVGFGDNNISVIDLVPGSPTEYHVVQHIGFPRVAPR
jgi:hypothetical protein